MPDQPPPAPEIAAIPRRDSLVSLAVESLREHLESGHWSECLPSERSLCVHLQVSRPTIRAALQALEQQGLIELRGRVRRPTSRSRARSTPPSQSRVVRMLIPRPLQSMPSHVLLILDILREQLAKFGYTVDTHAEPLCFRARPGRALDRLVQTRPAAAWIAWGSKEPMQRWFVDHHVPIVIAGSCRPGITLPSIDTDFRATCKHAAELLWRKGHRRIALVCQKDAYGGDIESEEGFREGLEHHQGASLQALRHDGTAAHICSLLDRTIRAPAPPTAYFVLRSVHALTVLTHLMWRKISVPRDVAVLSRDHESYFEHTSPALSRYAIDPHLFARRLGRIARELADRGVCAPKAIRLLPRLIPGETV